MAQQANNSFEARIADLESAVRSLRATNLTDLASVTNAAGQSVPLASLAFGQVAAFANGSTGYGGNPNTSGTTNDAADHTPTVVVRVSSGRLRLDWSAQLTSNTAGGATAVTAMSVVAQGPYSTAAAAQAATPGAVPTGIRGYGTNSYLANDQEGPTGNSSLNGGTSALLDSLPSGYYLVYSAYSFTWDATGSSTAYPAGGARRRTVFATPF